MPAARLRASLPVFVLTLAALALAPGAALAAPFDGRWQVLVVSESGDCDERFSITLFVAGGEVRYRGSFQATASGQVKEDGKVRLRFSHEDVVVDAKGTVKGSFANGSWQSPSQRCGGTWTARKARG